MPSSGGLILQNEVEESSLTQEAKGQDQSETQNARMEDNETRKWVAEE